MPELQFREAITVLHSSTIEVARETGLRVLGQALLAKRAALVDYPYFHSQEPRRDIVVFFGYPTVSSNLEAVTATQDKWQQFSSHHHLLA